MKKTTAILSLIIIALVIGATAYVIYMLTLSSGTASQTGTVTIVDGRGIQVEVTLPVERIVSLNPGLTEMICAFGGEDRIVGRDASTLFPDSILEKPIVGQNSYEFNLELLLEKEPDLLVADSMLPFNAEGLEKIENAGIPVIIEEPSNVTRLKTLATNFGIILNNEEKASEFVDFVETYENLVKDRVADLTESEKTSVYIEWYTTWQSFAEGSAGHDILVIAGGKNIAAGMEVPVPAPMLNPEYVVEKNPEVIIRMIGQSRSDLTAFQATRDEILGRPGLGEIDAVKDGRVYVYDSVVMEGLRYPVGLLYFAKWLNPTLFDDIDPAAIHEQLIQDYFGVELEGVYMYP